MPTTTPPTLVGSPTSDIDRIRATAQPRHDPVLTVLAYALEVVVALIGLVLLWRLQRWARETFDARRRRDPRPDEVDFDVLEAPGVITEEILRDADDQRALLEGGPADDAIIECWHRFEVQAAAAGTSRRTWETSSEFTLRILELVSADDRAVTRLAGLYREARFSGHLMGEDDRAEALAALDTIHRGLRSLARGGTR
nr:DUF4129 domain-containing protein [Nocardioides luti]